MYCIVKDFFFGLGHQVVFILHQGKIAVSYPDPGSQQLRMDYITATGKVDLAHRSNHRYSTQGLETDVVSRFHHRWTGRTILKRVSKNGRNGSLRER